MSRRQSHRLAEEEVMRIVRLLRDTDMSLTAIGRRMSCSTSTIVAVNRKFRIRDYGGLRSTWEAVVDKAAERGESGSAGGVT